MSTRVIHMWRGIYAKLLSWSSKDRRAVQNRGVHDLNLCAWRLAASIIRALNAFNGRVKSSDLSRKGVSDLVLIYSIVARELICGNRSTNCPIYRDRGTILLAWMPQYIVRLSHPATVQKYRRAVWSKNSWIFLAMAAIAFLESLLQ